MKKFLMTMVMALCVSITSFAQSNSDRISFGVGALYERGLDATLSWEHETKYHNAWEFFANGYVKWDNCESCGHVCPESFWKNYRTWGVGAAYKPCVTRGRNHHGSLRVGASAGSDLNKAIGAVHVGYEHTYNLYDGWSFFFSVKEDITIRGKERFKTGVNLGLKIPL